MFFRMIYTSSNAYLEVLAVGHTLYNMFFHLKDKFRIYEYTSWPTDTPFPHVLNISPSTVKAP